MLKVPLGFIIGKQTGSNVDPDIGWGAFCVCCSLGACVEWVEFCHNTLVSIHRLGAFRALRKMASNCLKRMTIQPATLWTKHQKHVFKAKVRIRFSHHLSYESDKTRLIPSRFPQYVA